MDTSRNRSKMTKPGWTLFLEALAVLAYFFCVFLMGPLGISVLIYWSAVSKTGLIFTLLYCTYIYLDRHTCEAGGGRSVWFRNLAWWKYYRTYFPIEMHKTAELPSDRNYLLAMFPHGIFPVGAFSVFGTDVHGFCQHYPGLTSYLGTLRILFFIPFIRELMRMSGIVACSKNSVNWVLGSGQGRACTLVVGGAAESLHNQAGVYKTVLKRRNGFIRIALQNGAALVPVVAFGEVDIYDIKSTMAEITLGKFQKWARTKLGVIPMRFVGEGFLGILPRRVPIDIVVGAPIEVTRNENPSKEQVDALHQKFISSFVDLFEAEKHKYLKDPHTKLEFV